MKILGGKKILVKQITPTEHSFTAPLYYSRNTFGIKNDDRNELVSSFCLDISATQMKANFKIFEDMPNVHEWPISKLIQRELDKQRALMISRDYLLSDGYLKYFPPIIAVLIPTNLENLPSDTYSESTDGEIDELKKHIFQFVNEEAAAFVSKTSALARGIYDINSGDPDSGYLVWDENVVSAVIIDGQHRYKALLEAMSSNKEFQGCRVTVNLIDLVPVCKRQASGPTAVARDLFVSINNTPVEVDEARLILMDDRDGLATFTQVLVDDSEAEFPPAIRPELIDWRCDQGKHDNSLALTGVLTLRGVIGASMFENRSIASVDDRVNRKHVRKWLSSLSQWVEPDNEIAKKLGQSECLEYRFEIACAATPNDDEDDQPFLFSYSAAAAGVIKTKFRDLYLAVFREVYSNLTPFNKVRIIATNSGAFEKKSDLHRYLRAFSGQRKELEKESQETKQKVVTYKTHLKDYCDNHILLTVMGQKALFKALFEAYLSDVDIKAKELLNKSKEFVESFNDIYDDLHLSSNFDECFFSTKLTMKKGIQTAQAGDLGRAFWRGIILGHNGEIDYGPTAVELLKNVLIDVLDYESGNAFEFKDREKIINRHVAVLRRIDSDIEDSKAKNIAEQIVKGKETMVQKLLT